jgi:hypothetical protein
LVNRHEIGRRGEFLASYILESHGVECHHVNRDGSDLWAKVRETIITIEVKSASKPTLQNRVVVLPTYNFNLRRRDADWFCFVALDRQLVIMRPRSELIVKTVRFKPFEFNEQNQRRTIEELLNSC